MSLETLVVGYRPGNRRILEITEKYGVQFLAVRQCIAGCGYPVHFNASGLAAARDKDAQVVCDVCMDRYRGEIEAAL